MDSTIFTTLLFLLPPAGPSGSLSHRQKGDNLEETREIAKLLVLKGTVDILRIVNKGKTQYKDLIMAVDIAISTLNTRLKQLLHSKLITHHIIRDPERNEYYEITERGEKILKAFLDFEDVLSKID